VRLGILDVGSNTVHLLVVDAEPGSRPVPAADKRWDSPLLHQVGEDHAVSGEGQQELHDVIEEAHAYAGELGVSDFSAFATSAFREASNADALLDGVRRETGVDLHVLEGDDEARLTFLAARRWFGWGAAAYCSSTSAVAHSSSPPGPTRCRSTSRRCPWALPG